MVQGQGRTAGTSRLCATLLVLAALGVDGLRPDALWASTPSRMSRGLAAGAIPPSRVAREREEPPSQDLDEDDDEDDDADDDAE